MSKLFEVKSWLPVFAIAVASLYAACTAPAGPGDSSRVIKPGTVQSAGSLSTSETAAAKQTWETEWQQTLKAARKEGRVVLYGPPIAETRRAFTGAFQKAYPGISLEYTAMAGSETSPKIKAERRAGIYAVDVHIGGTTTVLSQLKEFAAPIKPFVLLPEVKNPAMWLGGKLDFSDDAEELNLVMSILADSKVVYNSELVDPREITSWWDLVKPKWKGKIIKWDPRVAGSGLATATFWYFQPGLGPDYMKAFANNGPTFSRDIRFQVETVARGKYSILISPNIPTVVEFQKAGMPLKWAEVMKEGTYSTAGMGSVIVMDKAPHPGAAAVFLNWLLGKEGQTLWTTTSGYASRRLDVSADHLIDALKPPKPGATLQPNYKEQYVNRRDEIMGQLNIIYEGF